jgi:hypothetical protein
VKVSKEGELKNEWYVATLILRAVRASNVGEPLTCFEPIHVLRAPDDETAYKNAHGEIVSWEFVGLEDLEMLPIDRAIRAGTEIRTRIFRHQDPSSLVHSKDNLQIFIGSQSRENRIIGEGLPFDE